MTDKTWTNWETSLVNGWLTNNEDNLDKLQEILLDPDLKDYPDLEQSAKADKLEQWVYSKSPADDWFWADLINGHLNLVNWAEIIEYHQGDN